MEEISEETREKLIRKWNEIKNIDLVGFFGGTFWIDDVQWQVIPVSKNKGPKFIKTGRIRE